MRSVRPSTVSISTSAGHSAGKRASKSGRTSATTFAATARTAGDESVGSAYSSSVALRSTIPRPIAYGSENCASTSLVGASLRSTGSTTIGIAWLTTPTRTRAMSSGPRSCSLASAIARSIGPWL